MIKEVLTNLCYLFFWYPCLDLFILNLILISCCNVQKLMIINGGQSEFIMARVGLMSVG